MNEDRIPSEHLEAIESVLVVESPSLCKTLTETFGKGPIADKFAPVGVTIRPYFIVSIAVADARAIQEVLDRVQYRDGVSTTFKGISIQRLVKVWKAQVDRLQSPSQAGGLPGETCRHQKRRTPFGAFLPVIKGSL